MSSSFEIRSWSIALDLRGQGLIDYFVAADKVVCHIARLEQFAVIDPEIP